MFVSTGLENQAKILAPSNRRNTSGDGPCKNKQYNNLPGLTHFLQRNLGNSHMQSFTQSPQSMVQHNTQTGLDTTGQNVSHSGVSSCCPGKEVKSSKIQTKLTIGSANDAYEQEADRVAKQIMRMPDPSVKTENRQFDAGLKIRRVAASDSNALNSDPINELNKSGSHPLSSSTRDFMEPRFGVDFGHVRLHTNQQAHETTSQIKAKAFTYGNHVWLGKGESEQNKNLMAHELTHVVQQGSDLQISETVQRINGGGAPCTPRPVASLNVFNNTDGTDTSPDNCCPNCPLPLGVSPNARANNRMEMEIEIANHCPGSWYDILRTRENGLWEEVQIGGIWQWRQLEHQPMGTFDDVSNNDECLTLQNGRFIYVEDGPGWRNTALPAPDGTRFNGFTGVSTDPDARQVVLKFRFAEWVNFKHLANGIPWTTISSPVFFHWHSTTWLEKVGGQWQLQAGSNEIARGSQTVGTAANP